jgi:hypothetical protein
MHKVLICLLILSVFSLVAETDDKNDLILKITDGSINWSKGILQITGGGVAEINGFDLTSSRLSSEKSAVMNSIYRAQRAVLEISFDGKRNIGDKVENRKLISSKLSNHIKKSETETKRYYSDGSVEFVYSVPLKNIFESILLKNFCIEEENGSKTRITFDPDNTNEKEILIVKMLNKKYNPALFPVIAGPDSEVLYDCHSSDQKESYGNVRYVSGKYSNLLEKQGLSGKEVVIDVHKIDEDNVIVLKKESIDKIKTELSPEVFKKGRIIFLYP